MPLSLESRSGRTEEWQAIDQIGDSQHARGVAATVIAIRHGNTLKTTYLSNGLFDDNAKLGKNTIVDHIFRWTVFATPLTACWETIAAQFRQFQIGQVTAQSDNFRQMIQQSALFQQLFCVPNHRTRNYAN